VIFLSESSLPAPRVEPTRSLSSLIADNPVLPDPRHVGANFFNELLTQDTRSSLDTQRGRASVSA
jgi:hypothetical protein